MVEEGSSMSMPVIRPASDGWARLMRWWSCSAWLWVNAAARWMSITSTSMAAAVGGGVVGGGVIGLMRSCRRAVGCNELQFSAKVAEEEAHGGAEVSLD